MSTPIAYSKKLIVWLRSGFVYKMANQQSPIERNLDSRYFWREQVIFLVGLLRAEHLLYVDVTNKRNSDCTRSRVHCVRGQVMNIPIRATNLGLSTGCVASISIEGIESCTSIDIACDGNINGETFLEIFK